MQIKPRNIPVRHIGFRTVGAILAAQEEIQRMARKRGAQQPEAKPAPTSDHWYCAATRTAPELGRWGDIGLQRYQQARRRVLAHAVSVIGNPDQAARWLTTEKIALSRRRPVDVLDTAAGRYKVLALLVGLYD